MNRMHRWMDWLENTAPYPYGAVVLGYGLRILAVAFERMGMFELALASFMLSFMLILYGASNVIEQNDWSTGWLFLPSVVLLAPFLRRERS